MHSRVMGSLKVSKHIQQVIWSWQEISDTESSILTTARVKESRLLLQQLTSRSPRIVFAMEHDDERIHTALTRVSLEPANAKHTQMDGEG